MSDPTPAEIQARLRVNPVASIEPILSLWRGDDERVLGALPPLSIPRYSDDPVERVAWQYLVTLGAAPEGPHSAVTVPDVPQALRDLFNGLEGASQDEAALVGGTLLAVAGLAVEHALPAGAFRSPPGAPRSWVDVARDMFQVMSGSPNVPEAIRKLARQACCGGIGDHQLALGLQGVLDHLGEDPAAPGLQATPAVPSASRRKNGDLLQFVGLAAEDVEDEGVLYVAGPYLLKENANYCVLAARVRGRGVQARYGSNKQDELIRSIAKHIEKGNGVLSKKDLACLLDSENALRQVQFLSKTLRDLKVGTLAFSSAAEGYPLTKLPPIKFLPPSGSNSTNSQPSSSA